MPETDPGEGRGTPEERPRFAAFVPGAVAEPSAGTSVLLCLSADSPEEVDTLADKALANGAGKWMPPQDTGFMYGRSFADPDGHAWEVAWMDLAVASGEVQPADMAGASA